ncbi:TPA: nucleotidyltransferase domain-containing protein [Photobacterium damselae]|uniref:nucleotidyltransferase domain-containing protein n=1 Tax=Photobacterium damselae TaxID=38293 RepID=UPI003B8A8F3C
MDLDFILVELKMAGVELKQRHLGIKFYLFGSILQSGRITNDVDILVIYDGPEEPAHVREVLHDLSHRYPLDLYFMTNEEESDLDFINRTSAQLIS